MKTLTVEDTPFGTVEVRGLNLSARAEVLSGTERPFKIIPDANNFMPTMELYHKVQDHCGLIGASVEKKPEA